MTSKDTNIFEHPLLAATRGANRGRPSAWIMRQAGRYMKEYRDLRALHSFKELCEDPSLAFEVSLLPHRILDVDALIVFYDILFPLERMGAPLEFTEKGPVFRKPLRDEKDLEALGTLDPGTHTPAVLETIRRLKEHLGGSKPVLGFAGAPFLVIGDALAVSLMRQKKFEEKDFALFHPGGSLGEKTTLRVKDSMHPAPEALCFSPEKTVGEFLARLNSQQKDFGFILLPDGRLAGMVRDRDLRKGDLGSPQFLARPIRELMSPTPPVVEEGGSGSEAMRVLIENNLTALPVVDKETRLRGFITLRDLLTPREPR